MPIATTEIPSVPAVPEDLSLAGLRSEFREQSRRLTLLEAELVTARQVIDDLTRLTMSMEALMAPGVRLPKTWGDNVIDWEAYRQDRRKGRPLTLRELPVWRLLEQGSSVPEVAQQLGLTKAEVWQMQESIRRKLG